MRYRFVTADVFTDRRFGGNQLAVLPDARGLGDEAMSQIAREFNLSETVFVFPPEEPRHTRRLRIFTPGAELPFAGHPTVGAAVALAALGEIPLDGGAAAIVFEEGVGPVPVTIRAAGGGRGYAELTAARPPEVGPAPPPREALAALLGLEPGDVVADPGPRALSCGVPYLFVPVRDRAALARVTVDAGRWKRLLERAWARDLYVFCHDPELPGSDLRARMFAPGIAIAEDPATGSAAAAIAGYLAVLPGPASGTRAWVIEQGFEMGRPSLLHVSAELEGGRVTAVRVGGDAVMVSRGEIDVD